MLEPKHKPPLRASEPTPSPMHIPCADARAACFFSFQAPDEAHAGLFGHLCCPALVQGPLRASKCSAPLTPAAAFAPNYSACCNDLAWHCRVGGRWTRLGPPVGDTEPIYTDWSSRPGALLSSSPSSSSRNIVGVGVLDRCLAENLWWSFTEVCKTSKLLS